MTNSKVWTKMQQNSYFIKNILFFLQIKIQFLYQNIFYYSWDLIRYPSESSQKDSTSPSHSCTALKKTDYFNIPQYIQRKYKLKNINPSSKLPQFRPNTRNQMQNRNWAGTTSPEYELKLNLHILRRMSVVLTKHQKLI